MKRRPETALRAGALLGLCALALLSGCMTDGGSSSTETGSKISLRGRVVDNQGRPLPGVGVNLVNAGVADTTDTDGTYVLEKDSIDAPGGNAQAGSAVDTLIFSNVSDGQEITFRKVFRWIDTLPDLGLVQRNITGLLNSGSTTVARVEAVVSGDGIPSDQPLVKQFFYNSAAADYSGFVYFAEPDSLADYSVTVNVYSFSGQLTGHSIIVPFTSQAGNVTVPAFQVSNALITSSKAPAP